jgi:beta-mannosidase
MQLFRAWRSAIFVLLVLGISSILAPQLWAAANQSIAINTGWEFRQSTDTKGAAIPGKWLPATVPGDVHLDLLRNKLIPPPFYRDNEAKLQWIEKTDWEYRTTIPVSAELLNRTNIDLVFDGLDTCARVYLNEKLVLTSDNMFRTYRIEAKPYLKRGANQLLVSFPSPIRCAAEIAAKDLWRPETHTPEKSYLRKAAYEYGWDGGPRFVTSGIWKPVRLEAWDSARISDFDIRLLDVTHQSAHILAEVEVTAAENTLATVEVTGKHVFESASQITVLHPGINYLKLPLTIEKPELWYPVGYGWQPIYGFHADVKTGGTIQDTRNVRFPLRALEVRREPDQGGQSLEFAVNGIPIFAKGANVIPLDSFPNRVTKEQLRHILQSAVDANMNMVRVWGGGYYETKEFYELCDELGIMVWQDFMFGNPWQPGTYAFKQNVAHEVKDQLKRLRNYNSIVLWYGNDEQESTFGNDRTHVTPETKIKMLEDYMTIFSGIIPEEIARYTPATPYLSSTFSTDYEEIRNDRTSEDKGDIAGNEESGDTHDYTVLASSPNLPNIPLSDDEKRHYRFVDEYGFWAFPDMRTIEAFTLPQDRTSLGTTVMKAHQKAMTGPSSANGYKTIHAYMLQHYGQPKDFPSMVYMSQVLQAEGIKALAEHLRQDRTHTIGFPFWQLNDCWPGVTGSSIDYYGRWKALQYYARYFYAPLLVSPSISDGNLNIYVISDKPQSSFASLRVRIMKFDGTAVSEKTENIIVPAFSSHIYMQVSINSFTKLDGIDPAKVFAAMDLTVDGKQVSSNLIYFVSTKQVHLSATHIESRLTGADGSYDLHLSSGVLARSVYVSFGDHDAKFSDNYFDLLPGEPRDIHVDSNASLDQLEKSMNTISLVDAIVSNPTIKGFVWK